MLAPLRKEIQSLITICEEVLSLSDNLSADERWIIEFYVAELASRLQEPKPQDNQARLPFPSQSDERQALYP
jgi:hypothetical protein